MFGFQKIKNTPDKKSFWSFRPDKVLKPGDVKEAREYINQFWPKLTRFHPKDDGGLLGLPKPYLVPAHEEGHEFDFNELYYWDSYFMIQGLLNQDNRELIIGILDDLMSLFERFKIIPNASRTYLTGRSQPPFLTSFIWDLFQTYNLDKKWLERVMKVAEDEYKTVWMGTTKPNARLVYKGLSRYYDINYINELAQAESGWDMSPRFGRHALEYLPVDLNALLYKYEIDFGRTARVLGDKRKAAEWETTARHRKQTMNELMWDKGRGLYYDYNYTKEKKGNVSSLASYYAMWSGLADEEQAKQMVSSLKRFENKGGLATTDSLPIGQYVLGAIPTQWAYPNGWAPLHFLVIYGLQKYGYTNDALRISNKWLKTNLSWFEKHHVFIEKYNVVQPDKPPIKGLYPSQTGFGWTNSVFERLCKDFVDVKV